MLNACRLFPTFCFCLCLQVVLTSSTRGTASRHCRHWLTLASQTPGCTTPGPSPTPPTPPAPASAASACRPLLDTTPICRRLTQTTRARTSSPTPTCITAQAPDPTSSPWWRRATPGASAPPPACCPAPGPREGPTAWWTRAWTTRARAWRPTAATATPPPPWAPRAAWTSPSGGLTDWQMARQSEGCSEGGKVKRIMNKKTLKAKKKAKKKERNAACFSFISPAIALKTVFSNSVTTSMYFVHFWVNSCTVLKHVLLKRIIKAIEVRKMFSWNCK